jgi:hypothetical protein
MVFLNRKGFSVSSFLERERLTASGIWGDSIILW